MKNKKIKKQKNMKIETENLIGPATIVEGKSI